jgi:oligoendopeptidase F
MKINNLFKKQVTITHALIEKIEQLIKENTLLEKELSKYKHLFENAREEAQKLLNEKVARIFEEEPVEKK